MLISISLLRKNLHSIRNIFSCVMVTDSLAFMEPSTERLVSPVDHYQQRQAATIFCAKSKA